MIYTNNILVNYSLRLLESQAGQRETLLRKISYDTYKAWQWIQENRDKFEAQVYGPAMIECNVTNPRYADIIEFIIKQSNLLVSYSFSLFSVFLDVYIGDRQSHVRAQRTTEPSRLHFSEIMV